MGLGDVVETVYWAVSRLAPQKVNSVPLPKSVDPFRFLPFRGLGHGSAIAEVIRDHYSDDVYDLLSDVSSVYMLCHATYQALCARTRSAGIIASSCLRNVITMTPTRRLDDVIRYTEDHRKRRTAFSGSPNVGFCSICGGGKLSLAAFFDSLIFDGFASAIVPCFICCHVTRVTAAVLRELNCVPPAVSKWGPVVMGLGVLAFTYEIIDRCVDRALDETIRVLY